MRFEYDSLCAFAKPARLELRLASNWNILEPVVAICVVCLGLYAGRLTDFYPLKALKFLRLLVRHYDWRR